MSDKHSSPRGTLVSYRPTFLDSQLGARHANAS